MSLFLDSEDVSILTGRKTKSGQIDALRRMGILFYVNAVGKPVVPRSAIEPSSKQPDAIEKPWKPNVLKNG
ncbi:DUF4224 domain-containing protein [Nitrosomonas oligotropha]|uniref:Uncharacterized protein DUF4224 n=1 Tax=Nitrosomonas oligotropha TaxID=42354 RepID=A0A1H8QMP1_9PROT|nr:DUF4224 domain-containing protein [Nitrosomonas oligotropha]PTQ75428.1 uncharacterized protein DUF4224 [Nitrosomonas oligotropha]SDW86940.1 protein of unknown function [Nitrosomonas oligotropha]SEO55489.1 protein of unknown function [Nitrosomonas oligotropha]